MGVFTNRMIKFILWPLMAFTFVSSQMAPKYKEVTTKATYEEKTKAYEEKTKAYGKTTKTSDSPYPVESYTQGEMADPPAHPGDAYDNDCKYDDVPFTDCDPFHLVKWRQMKLVFGGSHCESYKNETKRCSSEDFPPGTQWLISEHKKCLDELEHLKGLLNDVHHWIDVMHERGQSLFGAFNELEKTFGRHAKTMQDLHKQSHSYQVMMERMKKELEEWREKARELRTSVDSLKAKYEQLSREHEKMKEVYAQCEASRDTCMQEQKKLSQKVSNLVAGNRELKGQLLEAERDKDLVDTRNAFHQCKVDILNAKNIKAPTYDKDTHVNLDMQMWITHNQTKVEYSTYAPTTTTTTYKPTYSTTTYKPYKPYYTTTHKRDVPA